MGGGLANEYYVRVIPMIGNQIAGATSNTVIVRYDPEAEPPPDISIPMLGPEFYTSLYTVQILDYTPGAGEDPNKWGCVEFISVEPGSLADISGYEAGDQRLSAALHRRRLSGLEGGQEGPQQARRLSGEGRQLGGQGVAGHQGLRRRT